MKENELVEQLTNKFYAACVELDDEEERKNAQDEIRENIMPLIRSYAATERAGMREACANVMDIELRALAKQEDGKDEMHPLIAGEVYGWTAAKAKVRSLPDTAADEAIERVKAEARLEGELIGLRFAVENDLICACDLETKPEDLCATHKRIAELTAAAKETP